MNIELNNIFRDFTKSTFSQADKQYESKRNSSFIKVANESDNGIYMDSILMENSQLLEIDKYANDSFLEETKEKFRNLVGKEGKYKDSETIGIHPHFIDIEGTDNIENYYAVSMFVDIKNSTSIYLKTGDLIWTKTFKNTVLRIITIFMQVFDGHIHRLQGDAVFGYFVWKDKSEEDAIIDSLNAASFLLYYIEKGLNIELEKLGYEPLKIRIGIDFGDKKEVIWSEYGLSPATEVTTTSLHTDLAAKLQGKASGNTIMIGDNIKEMLDLPSEFLEVKTYQKNYEVKEDKYILDKPQKKYKMWIFKHNNYLKYFPYLHSNNFRLVCYANGSIYNPNLYAISKETSLLFKLEHPLTVPYRGTNNLKFFWEKENRGEESKLFKQEGKLPVIVKESNEVSEGTAYKGHHIMRCTVKQNGIIHEKLEFGIFIKG